MYDLFTTRLLLMLIPLLIVQLSLMIYCVIKILKEGVGNLKPTAWIIIVLFVNMLGPIAFLLVGRKQNDYNS